MAGITDLLIKSAAWSEVDQYITLVLESAQTFARKLAEVTLSNLKSIEQAGLAAGAIIQQTRGIGHKRFLIAGQPGFVQRNLDLEDTVANEAVGLADALRGGLYQKFRNAPGTVTAGDITALQQQVDQIVNRVKRLSDMRRAMMAAIETETKAAEAAKQLAKARPPKLAPAAKRLNKLIDDWDPELRKAFMSAVSTMRGNAQIEQLIKKIEVNDIEGALKAVSLDPVAFRAFDKSLIDTFEAGGKMTSGSLPGLRQPDGLITKFQFNIRNPTAESWLSNHSSQLITEIMNDQRALIRERLRMGMLAGENPRKVALDLVGRIGASGAREGGLIGLTSSQAEWVRNYAAELESKNPIAALSRKLRDARFDGTVRRYVAAGEAIPAGLRDKMVQAYTNRALRLRAEGIARTEAMAALHEAQQQSMAQAIATGAIATEQVTFIWRATNDLRTRDSHAEMNGQEQPMGEMFITGDGNELAYPGDPMGEPEEIINCRCWLEPNVDFLAGLA